VLYRYFGDAKVWSNPLEDRRGRSLPSENHAYRTLKPRHLCILNNPESDQLQGVSVCSVADWEANQARTSHAPDLKYLFVAYSTEHFNHASEGDMRALHRIAEAAARQLRIPAYWVACSCMRSEEELEADVCTVSSSSLLTLTSSTGVPHCRRASWSGRDDNCRGAANRDTTKHRDVGQ
jgi:hypothetical protein